ncbi:Cof-type HAD-IIB family hydrolase [Clostridium sp. DJ247]|uniref:Cof-type HAD-IIB family hydrolase n=1 Tax=Clostridium sp. DJ247 TaxID=2726188 RepID=UPI00162956C9|nr:Cof-type HAD-IIB family hydrolase [Clostridium sp. DJ247]MBC2582611.1 HAD family phosphatase [Clostridium sp. DJ247]
MSKFKMICLDIDGTLLNSQHRISENTKKIIQVVANEKQIPVILVSARMPKGILFLQKELNIVQPIICYSGSLIMDKDTNVLLKKVIPLSSIIHIYNLVKNTDVHISLYKDDEWYIEELDEWAKQESEITNIVPTIVNFYSLFDLWKKENTGPNKVLCMAQPDNIQSLNTNIKADSLNNLNIYPSKPTYLEIMSSQASKTSAIDFLRRKFDIQKSEIIAMGDNYNDIDMIEYAGLGIAMGNAPDQVKQYANEITLTNDEDGVAEAIKKYVLS